MAFVRSSISIAAMLSAVILAGCGGDTSETDASEAPAASATSSTTAAASAPDADATPLPTEQVFSGAELAEAMVARNDQITIEATDDGVLISGMVDNPRSSGDLLDSATVELSSGFEEFVTGRTVIVEIDAAGGAFSAVYSTSEIGNSDWQPFEASETFTSRSFSYAVRDSKHEDGDFVGIVPSTEEAVRVKKLRVTVE